ncbi:unnamed protein product, partial [Protopolystoma xenopodis]
TIGCLPSTAVHCRPLRRWPTLLSDSPKLFLSFSLSLASSIFSSSLSLIDAVTGPVSLASSPAPPPNPTFILSLSASYFGWAASAAGQRKRCPRLGVSPSIRPAVNPVSDLHTLGHRGRVVEWERRGLFWCPTSFPLLQTRTFVHKSRSPAGQTTLVQYFS